MPTEEQRRLADEVTAIFQSETVTQSDLDRAKRLMRDWPDEMEVLKVSIYETIYRIEDDTL